ncbi:hypothetical protein [Pontibacter sp. G13]|uniref:hypothetical protein n=1 Tax=Pontibacter sp. G13 TaxID=3074898 RepID=UPI002889151F|nr:hypothetical protein [Pontibacter sp. G13]WNJ19965.1 hypothetical protein RJD25_05735 [Pontibacter sp. G13]
MSHNQTKTPSSSPIHIPIIWEGMDDQPDGIEIPIAADIGIRAALEFVISGVNGMLKEGALKYDDFKDGKLDEKQFTYRVVSKGTESAVIGGIRTASALTLSEGAKRAILRVWGPKALLRLTRFNVVTSVAYGVVNQGLHTFHLYNGKLTDQQYKVKSAENIGSTGGAIGGAAAGAMLGSVVPGMGTAMGAVVGMMLAMMGAAGGAALGKEMGEEYFLDKPAPSADNATEQDN